MRPHNGAPGPGQIDSERGAHAGRSGIERDICRLYRKAGVGLRRSRIGEAGGVGTRSRSRRPGTRRAHRRGDVRDPSEFRDRRGISPRVPGHTCRSVPQQRHADSISLPQEQPQAPKEQAQGRPRTRPLSPTDEPKVGDLGGYQGARTPFLCVTGGVMACARFGANPAWWRINSFVHNTLEVLKGKAPPAASARCGPSGPVAGQGDVHRGGRFVARAVHHNQGHDRRLRDHAVGDRGHCGE